MYCVFAHLRRTFRDALVAIAATTLISLAGISPAVAQGIGGQPTPASTSTPATGPLAGSEGTPNIEPNLPTLPDAIPKRNLLTMIRAGGPLMVPIIGCSFLLVVFAFERTMALRRGRIIPGPFVTRFLEQLDEDLLDRDKALELCEENQSPVAEVFAAAVKKWGRPSVEVEQAVLDAGERVTNGLRKHVRLFNAISTVSPLLGLLGTVFGMIASFNVIASAESMGRPDLLADGIGEALITTAAGLSVAIPALIAYWFFVSRVDRLVIDIDGLGQQVVELFASDGRGVEAPRARTTRKDKAA